MRITIDDILRNKRGILKLVDKFGMDIPNDIEGREFRKLFDKWKSGGGYETNYYFAEELRKGLNMYLSCNNDFSVNEIKIRKKDIMSMVSECVGRLLTEDQAAKSISAAIKLAMSKMRLSHNDADDWVRNTIRGECPILRTDKGSKFILGVVRLNIESGRFRHNVLVELVNSILNAIVTGNHINEFDRNLNGLSLIRLMNILKGEMEANEKNERVELNKFETGEGRYDIVKIDSFDDASAYSKYVSWCITQDSYMFERYTNGGVNQFYFCLRDDFMDCNPIVGENCPLDNYGLSMIAVSVNSEGKLATCTCRWNHDNGGNDSVMNAGDISKVIGRNFYNVFKPNNNWDYAIEDMKKKLAEGVPLEKIFDFIDVGFPPKKWSVVYYKNRANFISKDGIILSDEWFDDVSTFCEGYAVVTTKYGDNLIGEDGKYLFKTWYDHLGLLRCGLVGVEMNLKYNYLRVDETVLCKTWFDMADDFVPQTERAKVYIEGKGYNLIDTNGNFILKEWVNSIMRNHKHNLYQIFKTDYDRNRVLTSFVDVDGNMIVDYWFVRSTGFMNGKCVGVYVDDATGDEYSLLFNSDGEILGREKLDDNNS